MTMERVFLACFFTYVSLFRLEPVGQLMTVEESADQAIAVAQAFLVENELGFPALPHSLGARHVRYVAPYENGFKGYLRADVEAVGTEPNPEQFSATEHLEGIGGIRDAISDCDADADPEEELVKLVTERDRAVIPCPDVTGALRQDGPLFHFFVHLGNKMYNIDIISRNENTIA